jgi:hypothetical protein
VPYGYFLFDRKLDLAKELPPDEYQLFMTREAKFEIAPIPESKAALKAFIEHDTRIRFSGSMTQVTRRPSKGSGG